MEFNAASAVSSSIDDAANREDFVAQKRKRLFWMVGVSFVVGVCAGIDAMNDYEWLLVMGGSIALIVITASWCELDAQQREYKLFRGFRAVLILFPIIGLSVYFLRTRGVLGIFNIVLSLLIFGVLTGIQILGFVIANR